VYKRQLPAQTVFDPATGAGAFFRALRVLSPQTRFYGNDIDETLLRSELYRAENCDVEIRDFLGQPPERKFSSIVANPPYIRHHRISEEQKAFLKVRAAKSLGFVPDGRMGLHVYFLIQALESLVEEGKLAVILPADVCEGVSSQELWRRLTARYRLEAVVTFASEAAPFKGVDTNAIVFFIKNVRPEPRFVWIRVLSEHADLERLVNSGFSAPVEGLEVRVREIAEGIETGLSRPPRMVSAKTYTLSDFARVMRGVATGANDFFTLTRAQMNRLGLPPQYFVRTVDERAIYRAIPLL
jgi:methylase of polypeptide subunit release factors